MKKNILLLFLITGLTTLSYGQDIITTTLKWNATKTVNVTLGNSTMENTSITSSASSLVWKNHDDTVRKTFQIIEAIGDWKNINTDGTMQYQVTDGRYSETIFIRKQGNDIKIVIMVASDTPETSELTIQNVQLL